MRSIKPSKSMKVSDAVMFPSDIVPEDEKEQEQWAHRWVDAIQRYSTLCFRERDIENYAYAQGNIPLTEFAHITDLYCNNKKLNKVLPAKMRNVNAIAPFLNRMMGKLDAQDISFTASMVNEDAVTKKLSKLTDKQTEDITRFIRQQSGITELLGRPLEDGDDLIPVDPKELEERNLTTFQEDNEIEVSKALKYLMQKKDANLKFKFIHQGFYNYLITGKMAFDTNIDLDDPNADPIDTRFLVYDLESRSPFLQHGRFAAYWFSGTTQEIIDRCPEMTKAELDYVDEMSHAFVDGSLKGTSIYWQKNVAFNTLYLNCMKGYWKAVKKRLVKLSPNKYDEENPHAHFVSEEEHKQWKASQKKKKEDGKDTDDETKFEYRYYSVEWEFTKIGEKIYYQTREKPNQLRDDDEPAEITLSIIGVVDDNPCPVELIKPLQAMRMECFYNLELLMSQPMGRVLFIDEAMEDDDVDNVYNMRAFRVWRYNSAREGDIQAGNVRSNLPKTEDFGLSEAVNDLIRLVAFIDMQMANITGINEPAQGIVKSDQGLGVTQSAIEQSQLTIQPYYSVFYNVIESVLQRMCDLMRPAWSGKKKTAYWLGDKGAEFFNLDPSTDWHLDKYGIFIQNSVSMNQAKEMMTRMASQLLPISKDPNLALSIIKMFTAKSAAEAELIFEKGVLAMAKIRKEDMAMQEKQLQAQQQGAGMQAQQKDVASKRQSDTVIKKASIEADAMRDVAKLKTESAEDQQTVDYQNELSSKLAEHLLEQENRVAERELQSAE